MWSSFCLYLSVYHANHDLAVNTSSTNLPLFRFYFPPHAELDQVYVPLIAHCVRPQVSEDRPGGNPGLGLESARTLAALGSGGHAGVNSALSALLTPGGLACLQRSPDELIRVLRTDAIVETPRLVWGPTCREELEELLKQVRGRSRRQNVWEAGTGGLWPVVFVVL